METTTQISRSMPLASCVTEIHFRNFEVSIIPTWVLILVAVSSFVVAIMPPKWLNPMIEHLNRVFKFGTCIQR